MTPDLSASVWATLQEAWLFRFALIAFGAAAPAEVFKYLARRTGRAQFRVLARMASGLVVGLCLASWGLVYDTYLAESNDATAVSALSCSAQIPINSQFVEVKCPGQPPTLLGTSSVQGVGPGKLVVLAHSGVPVTFTANGQTP